MTVPMVDLRAEYISLQADIDAAIQHVLEQGTFVLGKAVEAFEVEFARHCGAKYAVGVGSGTAALQLALLACGIGKGDEVITTPNTDLPSTLAISHAGADIVWVDVEPRTFNLDPQKIEAKITARTKAILPVHLFGHPADMESIVEIARRHDLWVIDDAALAVGARYKEQTVGSLGDVTCFSLAPTKILGAYGDAGIVVTDNKEIADRIRVLGNYGHSLKMEENLDGVLGTPAWELIAEGYNERLDELQAAVLNAKLPTLNERIARRRRIACEYNERLTHLDLTLPIEADYATHVYRAYTVLVDERNAVRDHLAARDIATRIYYVPPLHVQPVYEHLGFQRGDFPVTEWTSDHMLSLPIFPEMIDDQLSRVVAALEECVPQRVSES